jgi:hypothetical protein
MRSTGYVENVTENGIEYLGIFIPSTSYIELVKENGLTFFSMKILILTMELV